MTEQQSTSPNSFDLVHNAIMKQAFKIGEVLKSMPLSADREKLEDHFLNHTQSTFDTILDGRASVDTPVYEWDYAFTAVCRAIDEFHAARAMHAQGNLSDALECLMESARCLGANDGTFATSYSRGMKGSIARHKDGVQAAAKAMVRACWEEWQKKPSRYRSQAEFAQDMLSKVPTNHRGEPAIAHDTITRKWIHTWNKEKM